MKLQTGKSPISNWVNLDEVIAKRGTIPPNATVHAEGLDVRSDIFEQLVKTREQQLEEEGRRMVRRGYLRIVCVLSRLLSLKSPIENNRKMAIEAQQPGEAQLKPPDDAGRAEAVRKLDERGRFLDRLFRRRKQAQAPAQQAHLPEEQSAEQGIPEPVIRVPSLEQAMVELIEGASPDRILARVGSGRKRTEHRLDDVLTEGDKPVKKRRFETGPISEIAIYTGDRDNQVIQLTDSSEIAAACSCRTPVARMLRDAIDDPENAFMVEYPRGRTTLDQWIRQGIVFEALESNASSITYRDSKVPETLWSALYHSRKEAVHQGKNRLADNLKKLKKGEILLEIPDAQGNAPTQTTLDEFVLTGAPLREGMVGIIQDGRGEITLVGEELEMAYRIRQEIARDEIKSITKRMGRRSRLKAAAGIGIGLGALWVAGHFWQKGVDSVYKQEQAEQHAAAVPGVKTVPAVAPKVEVPTQAGKPAPPKPAEVKAEESIDFTRADLKNPTIWKKFLEAHGPKKKIEMKGRTFYGWTYSIPENPAETTLWISDSKPDSRPMGISREATSNILSITPLTASK